MTLDDIKNKTCLVGLTYLSANGDILKQTQVAGTVIKTDAEEGISIQLMLIAGQQATTDKPAVFHLPPSLDAWHEATAGHFKNADHNIDITDPDYFVTWDIIKKKDDTPEGTHEWWEWMPRTSKPNVS